MPFSVVFETAMSLGAISTRASPTVDDNFGPSSSRANPQLLRAVAYDRTSDINPDISRFVEGARTQNVSFLAFFASQCTDLFSSHCPQEDCYV
ncbi:MAG: hypothetical protein K0U98_08495 [Deltaproteobacteria bacterium]|nr:hypothetical protein [Deltaproteobacteria bacterium]